MKELLNWQELYLVVSSSERHQRYGQVFSKIDTISPCEVCSVYILSVHVYAFKACTHAHTYTHVKPYSYIKNEGTNAIACQAYLLLNVFFFAGKMKCIEKKGSWYMFLFLPTFNKFNDSYSISTVVFKPKNC